MVAKNWGSCAPGCKGGAVMSPQGRDTTAAVTGVLEGYLDDVHDDDHDDPDPQPDE